MVMFCVTELSFKVSLFSIVVDEEEDGGVKEFKIDSNGISVLIIENKKLIYAISHSKISRIRIQYLLYMICNKKF